MSPSVEEALKTLTITCNISALHVQDEDNIKLTLRALDNYGEILDPTEIEAWVSANGWQSKPTKNITDWSQKIASNSRVQLKFKSHQESEKDIIHRLQEKLKS